MEKYRFSELEQKHMEESLMPFAVYQFLNKRVVTITLSQGFCNVFGYADRAQAYFDMDNDMYKDAHPDDAARIADAAFKFATEGGEYNVIYRTKSNKSDGYKIVHAHGVHTYADTGERLAQVWYTDEGEYSGEDTNAQSMLNSLLKNALYEESFFKASYYDFLTGLPSMTYFFELASETKRTIAESGFTPALMFMDFSGMKYYNHKYGFAQGDKLLQSFSRLLATHFGNENCCRIGQDHFAVIAKSEGLEQELETLFKECTLLNESRSLPLHVGIYPKWHDSIVTSMACDRAKFACDKLKNEYSSGFNYYNMEMKDLEEKQQYIIANIDKAIKERWIKVYYQPIIRAVNGRVCDEEALARWIDPVKGFMSPADFIPILEDHKLIYKLDLYVVECVLKKIRILERAGLHIVPQSVNLSRSDFDSCDIVEEIRRRVDSAGISRDLLTIEITESMIGKDYEFMRTQIERFKALGFTVWMDDFGSGYSSLDLLQDLKFDLIKFDMRFMKQLKESGRSRIILTELLKMAVALGTETICEGVETIEQAQFLQETGCTKLQGFYFNKPIPVEMILERYQKGIQIGFEDPDEKPYYAEIGKVNLHDLSVIAQEQQSGFDSFFNTLPMAIIEMNNDQVKFTRSNQSYRDFIQRYFNLKISDKPEPFHERVDNASSLYLKTMLKAKQSSEPLFITETIPGGTVIQSCMRRIAINPVNGAFAVATAVLSMTNSSSMNTSYESIAKALSADYFNLFYVDLETEDFYEYSSEAGEEELSVMRHDTDFFSKSRRDAQKVLYVEDREAFINNFTKENVVSQLDKYGIFTVIYRLDNNGDPIYVCLKATRMPSDNRHIIIGVNNVDSQVKREKDIAKMRRSESIYSKVMAVSGDFLCIYIVDPATGSYVEYSADESYKRVGLPSKGQNIYEDNWLYCSDIISMDDQPRLRKTLTRENVLAEIKKNGIFTEQYTLNILSRKIPISVRAIPVNEEGTEKLLIALKRA